MRSSGVNSTVGFFFFTSSYYSSLLLLLIRAKHCRKDDKEVVCSRGSLSGNLSKVRSSY